MLFTTSLDVKICSVCWQDHLQFQIFLTCLCKHFQTINNKNIDAKWSQWCSKAAQSDNIWSVTNWCSSPPAHLILNLTMFIKCWLPALRVFFKMFISILVEKCWILLNTVSQFWRPNTDWLSELPNFSLTERALYLLKTGLLLQSTRDKQEVKIATMSAGHRLRFNDCDC